MVRIGTTQLNGSPRIALSITDRDMNRDIRKFSVDLLELRVDLFRKTGIDSIRENILERKKLGIPMLLTVRNDKAEGAKREMSDQKKWAIYEAVTPLVQAVDIEIKSPLARDVVRLARKHDKKIIVSWHNLESTPGMVGLQKVLRQGKARRGDIVKIATKARSLRDVERLLEFTWQHRSSRIITIAVGKIGVISRLTFPAMGSLLTYSFLGKPVGSGQLPIHILRDHFRVYYPDSHI